jgi:imidazole glycerol-phosphate synthase subunit HisF
VPLRVIARLDVKGPNLVKGIHLEGLRVIGDPHEYAQRYYEQGADELVYVDIVASLYGRNNLVDVVERTARDVFIPIAVGGGVRTLEDVNRLLRAGADKVAVNTAAIRNPEFIKEAAHAFGSQCVVVNIEAIRQPSGAWEAFTDNGRERTGLDAYEWALRATDLGAGELLVTSVDREGTRKGFDLELTRRIADAVPIPVIASGGAGSIDDVAAVIRDGHADAVAVASLLHYGTETIGSIKTGLAARGISVPRPAQSLV